MEKVLTSKKKKPIKIEPLLPILPAAKPQQKISSKKCIIFPRFKYIRKNYNEFRVKRAYCKVFSLDDTFFYYYERDMRKPNTLCRKMKYLRGLEINSASIFRTGSISRLMRSMQRIESVKLELGNMIFFQLQPGQERMDRIFKNLRCNLTSIKVNVSFGFGVTSTLVPEFVQSLINGLKTMINLKSLCIILKNYASIFGTSLQVLDAVLPMETPEKQLCQRKFQRLKKLEDLRLIFSGPPNSILGCFTQNFGHLYKLKNLEIVSFDQTHGRHVAKSISRINSLSSVTFYYSVEPNDLLLLLMRLPNLKRIQIKDDWFFTSKNLPLLSSIDLNSVNVTHLHLDLPMDIDTDEDVAFISHFIKIFRKLKSLKLYIRCQSSHCLPHPIAKAINKLNQLEEIYLGLVMVSGKTLSDFLSIFDCLKNLKRIYLVMKLGLQAGWCQDIQSISKALKSFVSQAKSIEKIEIFWDKIVPQCIEMLKEILKKLPRINLFKLGYTSAFRNHGKNHEKTLAEVENVFKSTTNIEEAIVMTICSNYSHKNCESKGTGVSQVIKINSNLKHFIFIVNKRVETPFYGDSLG